HGQYRPEQHGPARGRITATAFGVLEPDRGVTGPGIRLAAGQLRRGGHGRSASENASGCSPSAIVRTDVVSRPDSKKSPSETTTNRSSRTAGVVAMIGCERR